MSGDDIPAAAGQDMPSPRPAGSPVFDRPFILVRFTLIIATSCLLLATLGPRAMPAFLVAIVGVALASNIVALMLPADRLRSPLVVGAAILGDTAWITIALIASGKFSAEFFYLYFFVLFLAGIGENIRLIVLSAAVVGGAYLVLIARTAGPDQIFSSETLLRIPFLFSAAVFYGYMVDRLRRERHRVAEERAIVEQLQRHRQVLADSNAALQAEAVQRERVEQRLRTFSRAVEQISNLVVITDRGGKITYVNPLFETIAGVPQESAMGCDIEVLTTLGAPEEAVRPLAAAIRNRTEWRGEIPIAKEIGGERWLSFSTSPVREADGEVVNMIVIAVDITERVAAESRLTAANLELRRLSQVKSNFVSTVSHELKSPLTAIKNAVALVDPEADVAENEKFLRMIHRSADRLNNIVSDLLDMSKVESGKLTIAAAPLDVAAFLREITEPIGPQAEAAALELGLEVADDLPQVLADSTRIEQVVTNLISNALKATPRRGRITVSAGLAGDAVRVAVSDTGVGIAAEDHERVFDAFFQSGNVLADRPVGTGLGLTICRDLVRGHGGELRLDSTVGEGSRFFFDLPVVSRRAEEIIAFENEIRTRFRAHPYFTILTIDFGSGETTPGGKMDPGDLETLHDVLHHLVPRALDLFWDQPWHRRIIVVMLSSPLAGGWVVKRRLASTLATNLFAVGGRGIASFKVLGPAGYPEDGQYGGRLLERAIEIGDRTEGER